MVGHRGFPMRNPTLTGRPLKFARHRMHPNITVVAHFLLALQKVTPKIGRTTCSFACSPNNYTTLPLPLWPALGSLFCLISSHFPVVC